MGTKLNQSKANKSRGLGELAWLIEPVSISQKCSRRQFPRCREKELVTSSSVREHIRHFNVQRKSQYGSAFGEERIQCIKKYSKIQVCFYNLSRIPSQKDSRRDHNVSMYLVLEAWKSQMLRGIIGVSQISDSSCSNRPLIRAFSSILGISNCFRTGGSHSSRTT